MNLLNLVLGLVLPIAISGYGDAYWMEHYEAESEEDWSEEEGTVDKEDDYDKSHYYYEQHAHEENKPKGHPITYYHFENYNKHVGDKPPAHGWENIEEAYEEHKSPTHGWDSSKDKYEEYKPPTHYWESSEEEYDKHKPSMQGWGCEEESNNGGPEKPHPKPISTKPQHPTYPQKPQETHGNIKPDPKDDSTQPTIDSSQRQDGQQTVADLAPANSNQSMLNTTSKPFYRPTLQNSTSLQMCRNYYAAEPLSQNSFIAVVGGDDARPKEFPHLALLGYGQANDIQWGCGGTLISDQFVLTAAHCLRHPAGPVQYVRLGELDLSITTEDSNVTDFTAAEVFRHPMYQSFINYYDIALLRLNASVSFNDYIRPACLATTDDLKDESLVVAGWGKLEDGGVSAKILQKATLKHVSNDRCRNTYGVRKNFQNGIVEGLQVCADGGDQRKDTCRGDSGGPLQVTNTDYVDQFASFIEVVGVTSFGGKCGVAPGVYTRVAPFVDWIEKIVWRN